VSATAFVANIAWPGEAMAFGVVASQVIGLGFLFEWIAVWKALGLTAGRAALATLGGAVAEGPASAIGYLSVAALLSAAIEAAVLGRWFGVPANGRTFAWLAGANLLSCVVISTVAIAMW